MNIGSTSERELRAFAYRIADDIETRAQHIYEQTNLTWEAAVDRAIHEISEKEY